MTSLSFIVGALAVAVVLGAFFAGRFFSKGSANLPIDTPSAIDLARLREREQLLVGQLAKVEQDVSMLSKARDVQNAELASSKEKSAGSDEKILALEQALSRERELNEAARERLSLDLAAANQVKETVGAALSEQSQKLAAAESLEVELRGQIKRAVDHITERDAVIKVLRDQIDEFRSKLSTKESELAIAIEREAGYVRTISERDQQLKGLQEKLKVEFENIANKILAATSDRLSEKSQEDLSKILEPLKTRITEFQQKVEHTHVEDTRQRAALGEQIRNVAQTNQSIGLQAENLAKALKGDSQLRGRWGEVRLERILENSGLLRGREFVVQGGELNIRGEEGASQRPDVVILLPENRHFVIDSKVSLVDYLEYEAAETEDGRANSLRRLIASVRSHIDALHGKNYQYADAINSHDLVFMFMPIEGVAALVLQNDESIFEYAWKKKVVMVSPSALFMTMQTVGSIWRYERQSENAQAIAEQAGQLFDKLVGVVEDLNSVSLKIQGAADSHNEAMKKLGSGKGNALSRAQRLKSLGVTSKKDLPDLLIDGERQSIEGDDDEISYLLPGASKLIEQP